MQWSLTLAQKHCVLLGRTSLHESPRALQKKLLLTGSLLLMFSATALRAGNPPAVVRVSARSGKVSYRNDVVPLLSKAGCNTGTCHGNSAGKGGFRLSLRGDDPEFDFRSLTRDSLGRRVSIAAPDRSLALLKPTGRLPHEGGIRFPSNSAEAVALRGWIEAGATDDLGAVPRLKRIVVTPSEKLSRSATRTEQIRVQAVFADGSTRDVTRQACFDLNDPTLGEVSSAGLVQARKPCELTVTVRFQRGRGVSRIAFLQERTGFVWSQPVPINTVDDHVFAKLRMLEINPSQPATDQVFLRRAFLDAIGRLPEPGEARAFLADRDALKRAKLIDRLLERPEFADFWALKWADLLRNEEKTMGSKGVWVFQRWLRDQFAADVPLDELVRRIVAARGSTWTNPPSSFHRTNRDPTSAAEAVAQVFLGTRIQCARCHNHPFDDWTQDDYYGLAACFSTIKRKQPSNERRDKLDTHEINGDEVIYLSGSPGFVQPRTRVWLPPTPLRAAPLRTDGQSTALELLAEWLTGNNRQFARNLANRAWFHLMGRGIVEPVDDFRESNPPSNVALLETLTDYLGSHEMRLRPLVALIMKSRTYQLDAAPNSTNAADEANFARAAVRLLPAEVLLDAISQVMGVPDRFPGAPARLRATQLAGVAAEVGFLKVFGKPERLLTCECERAETTTLAQAFQMISGQSVLRKLEDPENRIGRMLGQHASDEAILEELYLAALCRQPKPAERESILSRVGNTAVPREAWQDVAWAILNSKEFLLRR
jgi:hypothetical protein